MKFNLTGAPVSGKLMIHQDDNIVVVDVDQAAALVAQLIIAATLVKSGRPYPPQADMEPVTFQ